MKNKLQSIEKYGKQYVSNFVKENKKKLKQDSYEGLLFFFSKVFYRGRKDEISDVFKIRTVEVLNKLRKKGSIYNQIDNLNKLLAQNKVNNHKDREMVIETLKFISKLKNKNITSYSVQMITNGKVKELFDKLNEIKQIGPKLAGLYIRDIVFLYDLEKYLSIQQKLCCQPIDTWVKQVSLKLGIINKNDKKTDLIATKIIEKCQQNGISPLLFNAGAWYIGARSFELLLETL